MTKREEDNNIPQLGKIYYTDPEKYDTEQNDPEVEIVTIETAHGKMQYVKEFEDFIMSKSKDNSGSIKPSKVFKRKGK